MNTFLDWWRNAGIWWVLGALFGQIAVLIWRLRTSPAKIARLERELAEKREYVEGLCTQIANLRRELARSELEPLEFRIRDAVEQLGRVTVTFRPDGTFDPVVRGRDVSATDVTGASLTLCFEIGRERAKMWSRQCEPAERLNARTWGVLSGDLVAFQAMIHGVPTREQRAAFDSGFESEREDIAKAAEREAAHRAMQEAFS